MSSAFTGTWKFDPARSRLSYAFPQSWTQFIECDGSTLTIRDEITKPDGSSLLVRISAKLDGSDHPVSGSPVADTMAYTRTGELLLTGIGRTAGNITIEQSIQLSPNHQSLSITFVLFEGGKAGPTQFAFFDRIS
jgi:hypothetical protein